MRFSMSRRRVCPGEEKRTLRKGALWNHDVTGGRDVTKRRTLAVGLLRAATYDLLKNA